MLKQLALIPACLLIPALMLLLWVRRRGDAAWWGCLACVGLLYAVSTPLLANALLGSLQRGGALPEAGAGSMGAQAVVVLSAEAAPAPEYGGSTIGPLTLTRLRYGARLHRMTGLPILVTGGRTSIGDLSLAEAMRRSLHEDFAIDDVWVETEAQTTADNARLSAAILRKRGLSRVLLVTSAWHMPRAARAFEAAGLSVIPAPTNFDAADEVTVLSFLPSARALQRSYYGLHEWIGGFAYALMRFRTATSASGRQRIHGVATPRQVSCALASQCRHPWIMRDGGGRHGVATVLS